MYLKNNKILIILIFFFILLTKSAISNEKNIIDLINYLNSLKNFKVSFIQDDIENISEGSISIGKQRVRIDYFEPSKILIILSENKGMYYNYELDEDEFFSTKKTSAWFFFEIFKNPEFFINSKINYKNNNIILQKNGFFEDYSYSLKLYFEDKPLIIRKIELNYENSLINLSFFNHNYDQSFKKNFFKLINPNFF